VRLVYQIMPFDVRLPCLCKLYQKLHTRWFQLGPGTQTDALLPRLR
jgi:hypothetical protein